MSSALLRQSIGRTFVLFLAAALTTLLAVGMLGRVASAETEVVTPVAPAEPTPAGSSEVTGFLDGFLDSFAVGFLDGAGTSGSSESQRSIIEAAALEAKVQLKSVTLTASNTYAIETGKVNKPRAKRFIQALHAQPEVAFAAAD